jgi:hypothetical protein
LYEAEVTTFLNDKNSGMHHFETFLSVLIFRVFNLLSPWMAAWSIGFVFACEVMGREIEFCQGIG